MKVTDRQQTYRPSNGNIYQ